MKIVFTGGGTGGHFYPLIAVAEQINAVATEKGVLNPSLYFFAPAPYSDAVLIENGITYKKILAGKIRRNKFIFSPSNLLGILTTALGCIQALWELFLIYPDVVFGKGAYGSFPTLLAARILRIPVLIHDSDSKPGRVNAWAGKFAQYVAVSYPDAAQHFNGNKVAWTGQPLRKEILQPIIDGSREVFKLEEGIPTLLVLGGSQGAVIINDAVIDTLSLLLSEYQIIHQVGPNNYEAVRGHSEVTLENNSYKNRYKPFPYLSAKEMQQAAGIADLVISRAGSTIFEIAAWEKPSIIIPIPEKVSHDQRSNAYNYHHAGACSVIEEANLHPEIIAAEINRILKNEEVKNMMITNAKTFARKDAAKVVAEALINIGLSHEK